MDDEKSPHEKMMDTLTDAAVATKSAAKKAVRKSREGRQESYASKEGQKVRKEEGREGRQESGEEENEGEEVKALIPSCFTNLFPYPLNFIALGVSTT
jgi:hypothetical protein